MQRLHEKSFTLLQHRRGVRVRVFDMRRVVLRDGFGNVDQMPEGIVHVVRVFGPRCGMVVVAGSLKHLTRQHLTLVVRAVHGHRRADEDRTDRARGEQPQNGGLQELRTRALRSDSAVAKDALTDSPERAVDATLDPEEKLPHVLDQLVNNFTSLIQRGLHPVRTLEEGPHHVSLALHLCRPGEPMLL